MLIKKRLFPRDTYREDFFDSSDKATGGVAQPADEDVMSSAVQEGTMVEQSQRDVVFTPFMLRVREAVGHDVVAPTVLHMEASRPTLIAVAVDEWFGLPAGPNTSSVRPTGCSPGERNGSRWTTSTAPETWPSPCAGGNGRYGSACMPTPHTVGTWWSTIPGWAEHRASAGHLKPVDQEFLEDLAVSLLSVQPTTVEVDDEVRTCWPSTTGKATAKTCASATTPSSTTSSTSSPARPLIHLAYPVDDGFQVVDVWTDENICRAMVDNPRFRELLEEHGLGHAHIDIRPVHGLGWPISETPMYR